MAKKAAQSHQRSSQPQPEDSVKAFLQAVKNTKIATAWKKNREEVEDNDRGVPQLPEGQYYCKITSATVGTTRDKIPFVNMRLVVLGGEYEGTIIPMFFSLEPDRQPWLIRTLYRLNFTEEELKNMDFDDLVDYVGQINSGKPEVLISCKHKVVDDVDETTKRKIQRTVYNYYINRLAGRQEG